ncbi:hypothetical protein RCL1_005008 [Eukaryota sp. TZLM3-RCL]
MAPISCLVVGMAGAGKTTLMQRLNAHVSQHSIPSYLINLDPAVLSVPFSANIDIRDTVDYKKVMTEYKLGPNGAIMTSLNLFSTKFDQVLSLLESKSSSLDYVFIDTPGQIEMMTWSASGAIITGALASAFPTCILYVVDTPRVVSTPGSFVSNMLYACSIAYNMRLPLIVVWSKSDAASTSILDEWLANPESLEQMLDQESSYLSVFQRSLSLVIEEFYSTLNTVAVSSLTGHGIDKLLEKIQGTRTEYETEYKQIYDKEMEKRRKSELDEQQDNLKKFSLSLKDADV